MTTEPERDTTSRAIDDIIAIRNRWHTKRHPIFVLDVDEYMRVTHAPDIPKYGNPDMPAPSTMVGVTRLSNPDFLVEIDLMAIVED